jgi:hypothetical protein
VHSHLEHVFLVLVSLINDTPGQKPGHNCQCAPLYSRLCIIIDIFVEQLMYPAMYLVNLFLKYRELLITDIVNMPRNNVQADSRFQKTVEYLFKNPNLTIQDGMKLAGFS